METIFINTFNSRASESNKIIYQFTDKVNFRNPNKNMALANLSIYLHEKTLNLNMTTINLKFLPKLGMIPLI